MNNRYTTKHERRVSRGELLKILNGTCEGEVWVNTGDIVTLARRYAIIDGDR